MALKLIFMGTPEFAVPILNSIKNSEHRIETVYTQPPKKSKRGQKLNLSPVHDYSIKNKLEVRYPVKLEEDKEIDYIKKLNPDLVVVVAYGKIIPTKILNIENLKFINVHASLRPRWRGAAPIQRSIIEMDQETGISIMKIIPQLDAGPFFLQEKIKIDIKDNYSTLSNKLSVMGSKLIIKTLKQIEKNDYNLTDQDDRQATYAKKIEKKESEIKWNIPSKKLIAKINGLTPNPGAWFLHKGSRIKIIEAIHVAKSGKEGEILENDLTIACKENAIRVLKVQKEGKKVLDIKDFLAGYKLKKGEILI